MTAPNELTPDTLRAGAPAARRLGMIITADYMERHADAWAEQLREAKTMAYHEGYRAGTMAERERIQGAIKEQQV